MSNLILPRSIKRAHTRDGMMTFDAATIDSTGVFLIGELERLDQNLHGPLASVTWSRDIMLREDVSIADEISSFTNSTFAAVGGTSPTGKAWIGKDSSSIASLALDIGKTASPLTLWGMELSWTLPELASAQQLGRPVDSQKFSGMQLKHNMDVDEMVYVGDSDLSVTGLVNAASVTNVSNAITGNWGTATADQILADINDLLNSVWAASGFAICPSELRIDPVNFSRLVSRIVSSAGNISLLEYLRNNSLSNSLNGRPLNIQPLKWLTNRGVSNANRMMAYTNEKDRVRFPMVPLQRTPLEYRGIRQITTYYGRLGVVEVVYPETIGYRDGI
ncbi:DUF2184 domain-containing protein [Pseudomonas guariconensis]|uniref:DUF2184 domain-containing protein n=1 Tax=Pseudomonas guariconensis TaxID=1288410 RepID=UPI0036F31160